MTVPIRVIARATVPEVAVVEAEVIETDIEPAVLL
jgi:hypothetical protein